MRLFLGGGVLVVSLIQTILVISVDTALNAGQASSWTLGAAGALWYGMYIGTLIWTVIYTRVAERRMQEERETTCGRQCHRQLRALKRKLIRTSCSTA
jgi:hypothetical protein